MKEREKSVSVGISSHILTHFLSFYLHAIKKKVSIFTVHSYGEIHECWKSSAVVNTFVEFWTMERSPRH